MGYQICATGPPIFVEVSGKTYKFTKQALTVSDIVFKHADVQKRLDNGKLVCVRKVEEKTLPKKSTTEPKTKKLTKKEVEEMTSVDEASKEEN